MTAAAYERVLAAMEGLKLFSLGSGAGLKTVRVLVLVRVLRMETEIDAGLS
jgi:hypothetical protein